MRFANLTENWEVARSIQIRIITRKEKEMRIRWNSYEKLWEVVLGLNVIGEFETYEKASEFKKSKMGEVL